ncbi:MAG: HAD family hydrolase [Candidatus Hermodarchaeota archaeon]
MADIRLIVFDLDGTLLDSAQAYIAGVQATIQSLGLPKPNTFEIRKSIGKLPLAETLGHLGLPRTKIQKGIKRYHELRSEFSKMISMYPGVIDLLSELKAKNIKCAVLTMKGQASADYRIDQFKLRKFFTDVIGVAELSKTATLRKLLLKHKVKSREVIMIGDGIADIKAAKEVGTWAIAINSGYQEVEKLKEQKPDFFVATLQEILICINKIINEKEPSIEC